MMQGMLRRVDLLMYLAQFHIFFTTEKLDVKSLDSGVSQALQAGKDDINA